MPNTIRSETNVQWVWDSTFGAPLMVLGRTPLEATKWANVAPIAPIDRGTIVTNGLQRDLDVTEDRLLRVSHDQPSFQDMYVGSAINLNYWQQANATMIAAVSGGFYQINS